MLTLHHENSALKSKIELLENRIKELEARWGAQRGLGVISKPAENPLHDAVMREKRDFDDWKQRHYYPLVKIYLKLKQADKERLQRKSEEDTR